MLSLRRSRLPVARTERLDGKLEELKRQIADVVADQRTSLTDVVGIGPLGAGKILAEVLDVRRFPSKAHFASYTGTAPIDVSSGDNERHRLNRAGNRRLNHVLHIAAVTSRGCPVPARTTTGASGPTARPTSRRCAA